MLGHYLTVALRNFARYRLHTAVSVVVLTLGLTCFIAGYLVVGYLRSYDRHFPTADRSVVVFQGMHGPKIGFDWPSYPYSSVLLAEQLALDVPELQAVARYRSIGASVSVDGEQKPRIGVALAEPQFLSIFPFETVAGDLGAALVGHNAIITASAAHALFGGASAVGKTVTVTERGPIDATIVAVIADQPVNSTFSPRGWMSTNGFGLLLSWESFEAPASGWFNTAVATFALLPADGSMTAAELDRRLVKLVKNHVPDQGIDVYLNARPVSAIATGLLQSQLQGFQGSAWRVDFFSVLLAFAATVLVISCVNFVNLATARAAGRAREVGVRKAVGAAAGQVMRQEMVQTSLAVLFSIALALAAFAALATLIPIPYRLAFEIPWRERKLYAFLAVLFVAVTVLAGSYSSLVLARVRPLTALRLGTMRTGSSALRMLLVGSQFALASFLIVAVVVLFSQRADLRETLLGRFTDQYVFVWPVTPGGIDPEVLATELRKGPGIRGVTRFGFAPWQFQGSRPRYSSSPGEDQPMVTTEFGRVGYDYFEVMDIPLLAGRVFARDRNDETGSSPQAGVRSTPQAAVLDREAAHAFGWLDPADAIGKAVYLNGDSAAASEVIGVVESVPIAIRDRGSDGIVYRLMPRGAGFTIVRVAKDEVKAAAAHIDDVFETLSSTRSPPSRMFLDQAFETAYFTFDLINRVFVALGAFAIAIAAVGLFGMASYMTSRRTREIGLRKTQGATSRQILELLLWDFSKPVLVANLVVGPFALFAAERYLDSFAQRMTLGPWPFFVALLATLLVAFAAVASRVLRAARLRPTEALREE
jgi:putative ABC transport system permease protein